MRLTAFVSAAKLTVAAAALAVVSTSVAAQEPAPFSTSYGIGTWSGSTAECALQSMTALREAGFDQDVKSLAAPPPNQVVSGQHASHSFGIVICAQRGDMVIIVSGQGATGALMTSITQKLNEVARRR